MRSGITFSRTLDNTDRKLIDLYEDERVSGVSLGFGFLIFESFQASGKNPAPRLTLYIVISRCDLFLRSSFGVGSLLTHPGD